MDEALFNTEPFIKRIEAPVLTRFDCPYNAALTFNAGVVKKDGAYSAEEGCLSLLGGPRPCKRYKSIKVKYQTLDLQTRIKTYTGWTAQIIQHECDHLEGIVI